MILTRCRAVSFACEDVGADGPLVDVVELSVRGAGDPVVGEREGRRLEAPTLGTRVRDVGVHGNRGRHVCNISTI